MLGNVRRQHFIVKNRLEGGFLLLLMLLKTNKWWRRREWNPRYMPRLMGLYEEAVIMLSFFFMLNASLEPYTSVGLESIITITEDRIDVGRFIIRM